MPRMSSSKSTLGGVCMTMVMPRHFRRMVMRAPIVSNKHQKTTDVSYVGASANITHSLYLGVGPNEPASPDNVPSGNKVYSVDVVVSFIHGEGTGDTNIDWMLTKTRADQNVSTLFGSPSGANWSNIGLSLGRNQVIKSYMGQAGTEDAGPKTWTLHIKIPKIYQRVREGDKLDITFNATDVGTLRMAHRYKSFS